MTPPIGPIGDMGVANLTENVATSPITWETAGDWDAGSGQAVAHTSVGAYPGDGVLQMGWDPENFTDVRTFYHFDETTGSTLNDVVGTNDGTLNSSPTLGQTGPLGLNAIDFDGSSDDVTVPESLAETYSAYTFIYLIWMDDNNAAQVHTNQSNGNYSNWMNLIGTTASDGSGNETDGEIQWKPDGDAGGYLSSNTTLSTGRWHAYAIAGDGTEAYYVINGANDASTTGDYDIGNGGASSTDVRLAAWDGDGEGNYNGKFGTMVFMNQKMGKTALQAVTNVLSAATWTGASKSFAVSSTPNLDALDYSLNGESITVDVVGSPDTGSEEVVTQALDGSTSYSLTWSNSHTDFLIRVDFSTTTRTVSPTVNSISLDP